MTTHDPKTWYGTTILAVRKGGKVVVAGDGQVTFGNQVLKSNARKVRRLSDNKVIAGFAGATEQQHPHQCRPRRVRPDEYR